MSRQFATNVMTIYDMSRQFPTFYDNFRLFFLLTENVIEFVIKRHDNLRQFTTIYDIFCPVPFWIPPGQAHIDDGDVWVQEDTAAVARKVSTKMLPAAAQSSRTYPRAMRDPLGTSLTPHGRDGASWSSAPTSSWWSSCLKAISKAPSKNTLGPAKTCDPAGLVQVSNQPKCPKMLTGGCERCFGAFGPRVPKESLTPCKPCFAGT